MEVQNDPKPKRKFVMTPERHAKLMANLAKARLAPKEKVYRKTPKRYAANLSNLEKANAKSASSRRACAQVSRDSFPHPRFPRPPSSLRCPRCPALRRLSFRRPPVRTFWTK